jgi:uncharacterized repeat protein (TIGR03803 family)
MNRRRTWPDLLVLRLLAALAAALVLPAFVAQAGVVFSSLYSFTGTNDGVNPQAGLVQGSDGNFYGTTSSTVFRITPAGVLTTLVGSLDYPSSLAQSGDGYFYGTTLDDGASTNGTVFKMSANGDLTRLYSFTGSNDGANLYFDDFEGGGGPNGLVQGSDGSFYGTTDAGGTSKGGTVFRISTNGVLTNLDSFANRQDGAFPNGLMRASDGYFYGTTVEGGATGPPSHPGGNGTVFKMSANGTLTSLYSFTVDENGAFPNGLLQGSDGNFYGTTESGGTNGENGTVFKINTNGVLTSLYSFTGSNDGGGPQAGLVQGSDGYLYGTTSGADCYDEDTSSNGTVFKISLNGALTTLYTFGSMTNASGDALDGANPYAGLVQGSNGYFYGTTLGGGLYGMGTVFKLSVNDTPSPQIRVFDGTILIINGQTIPVDFGSVQQTLTGPIVTFTLTNIGELTLDLGTPTVPSGYTLITNPPATIGPGSGGSFSVQLNTANVGVFSGNISFTNNDSDNNPFSFAVTGTVALPSPQIQVFNGATLIINGQTTPVDFALTGPIVTFTVANTGELTLDLTNITVPTGYTLVTSPPTTIDSGSNGSFSVQLNLNAAVGAFASIIITNNDPTNNPFIIPITDQILAKTISLSGSLAFGGVAINSSGQRTLTISNGGNLPLTVSNIIYPTGFGGNFSGVITAGGSTNVTVTFSPTAATVYGTMLTVNSDATSGIDTIPISGYGTSDSLVLTIFISGNGSVSPNDNGKLLKAGAKYTLKALAGSGSIFAGWTGSINSPANPLIFTMETSTVLQANFLPDPFPPFVGTYNGLFTASDGIVAETNAGMIKGLTLTSKGAYSGSFLINGASHAISGTFDATGMASKSISLGSQAGTVEVVMNLTSNDLAPQVTGSVSGSGWVSTNLIAYRATNTSIATAYTMLIPSDTNNTSSPGGYGYASITATVGTTKTPATAKISGSLADGTPFSQSTSVSKDGYVPIYANLYSSKGLLLGWINLTNASGDALAWVHPAVKSGLFKTAFTSTNQILLSPWSDAPGIFGFLTNLSELDGINGTNLVTNIAVNINAAGKSTEPPASVTITPKTGLLTVTIGSGSAKVTGHGAILYNTTNGGGYFLTKTNAGAILLEP